MKIKNKQGLVIEVHNYDNKFCDDFCHYIETDIEKPWCRLYARRLNDSWGTIKRCRRCMQDFKEVIPYENKKEN